ncbi:unnamed protein product [Albugo candida]|uniref:RRM domain-containing protein n=1 Tax=Albugo candida TaxID=65357 RepID=A0A024GNT0_9STRA|nr:unnamed protein product [Albugo candida]|eukprot:CCI48205.1 unnamed protein product [Albugo candida]
MARRSHSPRSAARSDSRSPPRHKKSSPVSGKSRRSHRSRTPSRSRSEGRTKHDRSSTRRHRSKSRSSRRDRKRRDKSSSVSRSRERDRPSRRSTNDRHGNETTRPQSLLVRNLNPKTTGDDLRRAFSRRPGDIRDVYIPKDHSTNELRTFAFVEFRDAREAREVKYEMDRTTLDGNEIAVLFAQQRRKTPDQMRDIVQKQVAEGYNDRDSN